MVEDIGFEVCVLGFGVWAPISECTLLEYLGVSSLENQCETCGTSFVTLEGLCEPCLEIPIFITVTISQY